MASTPQERVSAYIREFHTCWQATVAEFARDVDLKLWSARVEGVKSSHFAERATMGATYGFSWLPPHPEDETITSANESGDAATVVTQAESATPTRYTLYELVRQQEDWLLIDVESFNQDPHAPLVPEGVRESILNQAHYDAALDDLPKGVAPNGDDLFVDGRVITRPHHGTTTIRVRPLGTLNLKSGVIGVLDLAAAYDDSLSPLIRRVPPGNYPIEIAIAYGRVAAFRIRFRDERSHSWHPARSASGRLSSGESAVGVDTGSIAIVDLASALTLNSREQRRVSRRLWDCEPPARATLTTLINEGDCVLCDSGWGDGGYPCSWGTNEQHEVVSLLVDFFVAVETLRETVSLPWTIEDAGTPLQHPLLDEHGVSVVLDEPKKGHAEARTSGPTEVGLELHAGGQPVHAATSERHDESAFVKTWHCDLLALENVELVVTLDLGYRN